MGDQEYEAFKAGFEFSAEGHNAEYVHPRFREVDEYEAMLRRRFDHWKATGSFELPDEID